VEKEKKVVQTAQNVCRTITGDGKKREDVALVPLEQEKPEETVQLASLLAKKGEMPAHP